MQWEKIFAYVMTVRPSDGTQGIYVQVLYNERSTEFGLDAQLYYQYRTIIYIKSKSPGEALLGVMYTHSHELYVFPNTLLRVHTPKNII